VVTAPFVCDLAALRLAVDHLEIITLLVLAAHATEFALLEIQVAARRTDKVALADAVARLVLLVLEALLDVLALLGRVQVVAVQHAPLHLLVLQLAQQLLDEALLERRVLQQREVLPRLLGIVSRIGVMFGVVL